MGAGSRPDTSTATFGEQLIYPEGPWTVQMNGSGLLNSTLSPEMLRHSIGRVNDYVMQMAVQDGSWGLNIRFGVSAPVLDQNTQFVTAAIPRQGVEPMVKTPGGAFGFYSNTNDLALGGGSGTAYHQQMEGASWELPLPKKYVELRFMWLGARNTGTLSFSTVNTSGAATQSINPILPSGGGNLYGGLLLIHLAPKWLWSSECGRGYNTLNLATSSERPFGREWRSGMSGVLGHTALNFGYFDVSQSLSSPVNPSLSMLGNPGRRGFAGSLVLPTLEGTFSLGYSLLESSMNALNFPQQRMNAFTENWSKNLNPKTILTTGSHQVCRPPAICRQQ